MRFAHVGYGDARFGPAQNFAFRFAMFGTLLLRILTDGPFLESQSYCYCLVIWFYLGTFLLTKREITSRAPEETGLFYILQAGVARQTARQTTLFGSRENGLFPKYDFARFDILGRHHDPKR
jgi:hypothetical protein